MRLFKFGLAFDCLFEVQDCHRHVGRFDVKVRKVLVGFRHFGVQPNGFTVGRHRHLSLFEFSLGNPQIVIRFSASFVSRNGLTQDFRSLGKFPSEIVNRAKIGEVPCLHRLQ